MSIDLHGPRHVRVVEVEGASEVVRAAAVEQEAGALLYIPEKKRKKKKIHF